MLAAARPALAPAARRRDAHRVRRAALLKRRALRRQQRWRVALGLLAGAALVVVAGQTIGLARFEAARHWAWLDAPVATALPTSGPARPMPATAGAGGSGLTRPGGLPSPDALPSAPPTAAVAATDPTTAPPPSAAASPMATSGLLATGLQTDSGPAPAGPSPALRADASAAGRNAPVGERDIGLSFMPGSQPLPQESSRVVDPDSGTTTMAALVTQEPMDKVLAFYRQQLGKGAAAGRPMEEVRPGPGQVLLSVVDPTNGAHQAVWIGQEGGQVLVRMVRAQPGVGTAPAPAGAAGAP